MESALLGGKVFGNGIWEIFGRRYSEELLGKRWREPPGGRRAERHTGEMLGKRDTIGRYGQQREPGSRDSKCMALVGEFTRFALRKGIYGGYSTSQPIGQLVDDGPRLGLRKGSQRWLLGYLRRSEEQTSIATKVSDAGVVHFPCFPPSA